MKAEIIRMITAVPLRAGHIIFRDDHTPIGVAARDIRKGETVTYNPARNTADVLARIGVTENADTPKL